MGKRKITLTGVILETIVWIKQIFEKQVIEDSVRKSDSVLT